LENVVDKIEVARVSTGKARRERRGKRKKERERESMESGR